MSRFKMETLWGRFVNALVGVKGLVFTAQASTPQAENGQEVLWVDTSGNVKHTTGTASTRTLVKNSTTVLASLTENGGALGGTNDGDLPVLTATAVNPSAATAVALTGTLTGTVNGSLADIAASAGACAGGATPTAAQVDTAIATAVATIVSGTNEQLKEIQDQIAKLITDAASLRTQVTALVADNTDNIAAIREVAAKENAHIALTRAAGLGVAA